MAAPLNIDEGPTGPELGALASVEATVGRSRPVMLWLITIVALSGPSLAGFMSTIVSPLGSSIANHFGGGNEGAIVAQMALTLPGVGVIFGGPIAGWLLERFGFRPVIAGGAALMVVAGTVGAYIDDTVLFLATRLLVGVGSVGLYTSMIALCGVLYRGTTLARMLSYQNGLSAAVGLVVVLLAGAVAQAAGWRSALLLYLMVVPFAILPFLTRLPATSGPSRKSEAGSGKIGPLIPALAMTVGVYAVVYMLIVQGSLLLSANGIQSPATQAAIISASTVTYALTATACSWIERRVTGEWTFFLSLVTMGVGMLILGMVPAPEGAFVGSLVLGSGSGLSSTYLFRAVVERATPENRNRAVGLIGPAHYVGQLGNPIMMQSLRSVMDIQQAFVLVAGLLLCAAVLAALSRRPVPRPVQGSSG